MSLSSCIPDVEHVFTQLLPAAPDFEHRPQQETMARAIAQALEERTHLIVEAPTGVGKTLAYLVPAILYAQSTGRKAIISTHTKNLQEQILCNDIPLVRSLLGTEFRPVILKGRRNYLCTTRLRAALGTTGHLFGDDGADQLQRIAEWSQSTRDGDIDTLGFVPDPEIWDLVCSEPESCSMKTCGTRCFFQRSRERARAADLIIMNHALFFTLLAVQDAEERFLFEDDFVIFDEAHTLETVAASGIGTRLSRNQMLGALRRVAKLKGARKRLSGEQGTLNSLAHALEDEVVDFFTTLCQAAGQLEPAGGRGTRTREIRIRAPHLLDNRLAVPLSHLQEVLRGLEGRSDDPAIAQEAALLCRRFMEMQLALDDFLTQDAPGFAYWVEIGDATCTQVTLCSSPCNVGEIIGPRLFRSGTSVIMTSATLAVGGDMGYFRQRVGADGVPALILDSPFDHARQMRLCIARDIPEPDMPAYAEALPSWILQGIDRSQGKALVLFTNAAVMRTMAAALGPAIEERGLRLLVQGADHQRHLLLEEFRRDIHSVLFGLDSFWMGVDVPGEALEHVIITRLPFAVPNHPLTEARMEAIVRRGGNAFFEYTLPEAVLKFRQGAGRLLRSRFDRGIVTLLDSRVLRKSYGRTFLSALPACPVELVSLFGESQEVAPAEW